MKTSKISYVSYEVLVAADKAEIDSLFSHTADSHGRDHRHLVLDNTPDTATGELLSAVFFHRR